MTSSSFSHREVEARHVREPSKHNSIRVEVAYSSETYTSWASGPPAGSATSEATLSTMASPEAEPGQLRAAVTGGRSSPLLALGRGSMAGDKNAEKLGGTNLAFSALSPGQLAMVEKAKKAYLQCDGVALDDCALPFLLRFLVANHWQLDKAIKHLRSAAAWRVDYGVESIRAELLSGMRQAQFPGAEAILANFNILLSHTLTRAGDILTMNFIAGCEPKSFCAAVGYDDYYR